MPVTSRYDADNPVEGVPNRLDVARYDANGRLLWNQTKLTRAMALTRADIAGFDAEGNLTLRLMGGAAQHLPPPQFPDGIYANLTSERLARLDSYGNALWVYELGDFSDVRVKAARDGSAYVIRTSISRRDDGFYVEQPPLLERLDAAGRPTWSLELPGSHSESWFDLDVDDTGNVLVSSTRTTDGTAPMKHVLISADGSRCTLFERPCLASCSLEGGRIGPDRSVYFAIGRVAIP
jgi:hypothetical protein